jgi:hypothetical protein
MESLNRSEQLLKSTWEMDAAAVAEHECIIEKYTRSVDRRNN